MHLTDTDIRELLPKIEADLRRWKHIPSAIDDLRQEALLAVIDARRQYQPGRGDWVGFARTLWRRALVIAGGKAILAGIAGAQRIGRDHRGLWPYAARCRTAHDLADMTGVPLDTAEAFFRAYRAHRDVHGLVGRRVPSVQATQDEDVYRAEIRSSVRRAVAALPDEDRCFIERRWLGSDMIDLRTLARERGVSCEAVSQRDMRIRSKLRRKLQKETT